jgi:hypothetical protein
MERTLKKYAKPKYNDTYFNSSDNRKYESAPHEKRITQDTLNQMFKSNTLTVCTKKEPEYYLKLIRYHFMKENGGTPGQILSI